MLLLRHDGGLDDSGDGEGLLEGLMNEWAERVLIGRLCGCGLRQAGAPH